MTGRNCATCKYAVATSTGWECHRYPPALLSTVQGTTQLRVGWPEVRASAVCGEWDHHRLVQVPDAPTTDRFVGLARAMGCKPEEVSGLVQQHAPWNGRDLCECAINERKAAALLLRNMGVSLLADAVEKGEHHKLLKETTP